MIRITDHAVQRYAERVEPCSLADARTRIMAAARGIEAAARIHCEVVRLGNGARLVLERSTVVTVYGRGVLPRQCRHSRSPDPEGIWL